MRLVATKKVGVLGRIVIPEEARAQCGMEEGSRIEIYQDGDDIVLKSLELASRVRNCAVCGHAPAIVSIHPDKDICENCAGLAADAMGRPPSRFLPKEKRF